MLDHFNFGREGWDTRQEKHHCFPWMDRRRFQRGRWMHRRPQWHLLGPLLQQPLACPRFGKMSHPGAGGNNRFASPSAETGKIRIPVYFPICWPFCTIPLETCGTCYTSVRGCTEVIASRLENVQRPILSSGLLLHFERFELEGDRRLLDCAHLPKIIKTDSAKTGRMISLGQHTQQFLGASSKLLGGW